ncbi:hypothetical protein [Pontibacillus salipaludis]|uniref:Uncharacterized protein n=1 Tax=Pontibacillus salipaludis TaxID=1697394 RepID=A0ABQ1PVX1_9BACI|nr:hypothetical protein [Pontibacillus salipaludis]GGD05462.1 hypothetical protein GCM10011389_11220 [Pontibacillus salipaludis]
MPDINNYPFRSGRLINENNEIVNPADGINSDGSQNVKLTGSNISLKDVNADSGAQVIAGGNKSIEIAPPEGTIWRTPLIWVYSLPPSGATSGSHKIELTHGINHYRYLVLRAESSRDKGCRIMTNVAETADISALPNDQAIQHSAIQNLVISKDYPLYVNYYNFTDVEQARLLEIRLIVTEERVSE